MKRLVRNIWLISIVLFIIVLGAVLFFVFKNGKTETYEVKNGDLKKTVEISGKVVPTEEIDLSFETSGTVSAIYYKVGDQVKAGDILAKIDSSEIENEMIEANANLSSEQEKLNNLSGSDISSQLFFKKNALIKTLNKSYTGADGIMKNQVDIFINDPLSRFPEFDASLGSYFIREKLNTERYAISKDFLLWKAELDKLNTSNVQYVNVSNAINYLKKVESYLSIISNNSSEFEPTSETTEAEINSYLTNVATSRSTVASLILDLNNAMETLENTESEINVQSSKIDNSNATVSKLMAKKSKYTIVAPFDGTITSRDLEVGQVAEPGKTVLTLISNLPLEIEAYIPEINIIGVDVGDSVSVYFDAIGDDIAYDGVISEVEPQETLKDGVVTYKILADLKQENKDLKPGMSSDLLIHKEIIKDQIILPTYLLIKEGRENFVNVIKNGKIEKVKIEISDRNNRGDVSVKSGISIGDHIVIPK